MKIKKEVIFHIICRVLLGVIGMYFLNIFFRTQEYGVHIGINTGSITTIACLGIPGFLLILGLAVYASY